MALVKPSTASNLLAEASSLAPGFDRKARSLSLDTCTTRPIAQDAHVFHRELAMHVQVHEKVKEFRTALFWAKVLRNCLEPRRHGQHWPPHPYFPQGDSTAFATTKTSSYATT